MFNLSSQDRDTLIGFLQDLVHTPSPSTQEVGVAQRLVAEMQQVGFAEITTDRIGNVIGRVGSGRGPKLLYNGHMDTVGVTDPGLWPRDPYGAEIEKGVLYGLGACDMKGGLCCAIYAAKAILDAGVQLKGELTIESVIGEEDGGAGALAAVLRGYTADGAVVMEPSETKIAPAHAGALSFRVTVPGRSAHACVREEGVSSIEKFILLHDALRALEDERNRNVEDPLYSRYGIPYSLNIGTVHGGSWPGSVAENLFFEGRIGVAVGEKVEDARQKFEEAIAEAASADSDTAPTLSPTQGRHTRWQVA